MLWSPTDSTRDVSRQCSSRKRPCSSPRPTFWEAKQHLRLQDHLQRGFEVTTSSFGPRNVHRSNSGETFPRSWPRIVHHEGSQGRGVALVWKSICALLRGGLGGRLPWWFKNKASYQYPYKPNGNRFAKWSNHVDCPEVATESVTSVWIHDPSSWILWA